MFETLLANFAHTTLGLHAPGLMRRILTSVQRELDAVDRDLETARGEIRALDGSAEVSEVAGREFEEAVGRARLLDPIRDALDAMVDGGADFYARAAGRLWLPDGRGMRPTMRSTAIAIEAREYLRAVEEKNADAWRDARKVIDGRDLVYFTGSRDYQDHAAIWALLDELRSRKADFVLGTGGDKHGGDAIAEAWARNRGVPVLRFSPQFKSGKHSDRAAPFKRNDDVIRFRPCLVIIAIEGDRCQLQLNMSQKAAQRNIRVINVGNWYARRTAA
ncbi:MAG: SLOG family protein [Gammaproteobacteria bacterium]